MPKMTPTLQAKMDAVREEAEREEFINRTDLMIEACAGNLAATLGQLGPVISSFMQFQGFWECDNTGEKIALMHSELSEALEADRKGELAEHIEGYSGLEEELADAFIRILDFAAHKQLNLSGAIIAKMRYNLTRPRKHGKAY